MILIKIIDMHCDTISRLCHLPPDDEGRREGLFQNKGHVDLKRMQESGYFLQCFALYINQGECDEPWEEMLCQYQVYRAELERNREILGEVRKREDLAQNEANRKLSALLTVEEGAVCKGEIEKLHKLWDMGVRMMTLTWNYPNELGMPAALAEGMKGGLTKKGVEFVREMEEMGMLVDVSHLSDAGFFDVAKHTKKPFVASHSDARSVHDCRRNLTDPMIRILGERCGLTGLNFNVPFLCDDKRGERAEEIEKALVAHARHIVNVGGMDVLGLGSDFDGIDTNVVLPGVQSMEYLWEILHKAGFTGSQLDKIFWNNAQRVLEGVL